MNDVLIRDLKGMDEFRAAEELQYAVWGEDEVVVPGDIMMVIQAEGGIAAGTFKDGDLIGFVFGFPTRATPAAFAPASRSPEGPRPWAGCPAQMVPA